MVDNRSPDSRDVGRLEKNEPTEIVHFNLWEIIGGLVLAAALIIFTIIVWSQ